MNKLIQAMNASATTENGCVSYHSTLSKCLDFFHVCAASRGRDISKEFIAAIAENSDVAFATLMYLRDVREGQGERKQFRDLVKVAIEYMSEQQVISVINKIPELGRFDDLEVFFDTPYATKAAELWVSYIDSGNGLAAKWAPRKDKKGAFQLRAVKRLSEANWRKYIVAKSSTVEQNMCSKQWGEINYSHVPSQAMGKYMTAFYRNDNDRFEDFKSKLVKGEVKINAGAVYPYDVIRSLNKDVTIANAQWKALPDFVKGDENFLPIIDVSGSMNTKVSGDISALDIAVSLGLYLCERNKGIFKDTFMTFSERPQLVTVGGTLQQRVNIVRSSDWGMSTDIESVFSLILYSAVKHSVPESDMPSKLLIVSDMQFNSCMNGLTAFGMMQKKYEDAGYKLPQIVFWQVNVREGSTPITVNDKGCALVSGFSPSIMKTILGSDLNPLQIMLDTVMIDRYKV